MSFVPSGSLSALSCLASHFGPRLKMHRDGAAVCWTLDGFTARVEPAGDGSARVTFVDRPARAEGSDASVAACYRRAPAYRLTHDGAGHLAADLAAFFGGVREPRFAFAGFA